MRVALPLALAAGAMASDSLTSLWLPNIAPYRFPYTLQGSRIAANDEATTVAVHCPGGKPSIYCSEMNGMTVTYGPTILGFNYAMYTSQDGNPTHLHISENMHCTMYKESAVCDNSFTDAAGEAAWSDDSHQTFTDLDKFSDYIVTITVTAGLSASTHGAKTTPAVPASTSTAAKTPTYSAPFLPTPEATGPASNGTVSGFPEGATPTEGGVGSESQTGSGSGEEGAAATPSQVTGAGESLSFQLTGLVGVVAVVGAAVGLM